MSETLDTTALRHFSGNPSSPFRYIGTVTLPATAVITENQQYAANWTEVQCEPQTVDFYSNGYYLRIELIGTIVGGGRNIFERPERMGTERVVTVNPYVYQCDDLPYRLTIASLRP